MAKKTFISRILQRLWSLFLNGLFTILPLTLTIALFNTSFKLLSQWLQPLNRLTQCTFLHKIPYAEFILAIGTILLVGIFVKTVLLDSLILAIEQFLSRIPMVRPIYSGIKQLVGAFNVQDQVTFKEVVLIEFPRKGIYAFGFLTGELSPTIAPNQDEKFFNIFLPTTPNPTTGFLLILPEQDIQRVDGITRHEAMSMVISGGIIQPERFKK